MDIGVTAAVVSGGTEGFNSILKFLGYAKDNRSDEAKEAAARAAKAAADAGIAKATGGAG